MKAIKQCEDTTPTVPVEEKEVVAEVKESKKKKK